MAGEPGRPRSGGSQATALIAMPSTSRSSVGRASRAFTSSRLESASLPDAT
jgi:hypothetical protein